MTLPAPNVARFSLHVDRVDGYEMRVRFDKDHYSALRMDEPPPLGKDVGPNPARVLAAAVGSCLSASLVFCLEKAKLSVEGLSAEVDVELVRNERHRLRIGQVNVKLHPKLAAPADVLARCIQAFEDFCVVTESVREGIDVRVKVEPIAAASESYGSAGADAALGSQ